MYCSTDSSKAKGFFHSVVSNSSNENDTHFESIHLELNNVKLGELEENQFDNLTFKDIDAVFVNRIHTNAFGKTSSIVKKFWCMECQIEHSPPNYDLWKSLAHLTNLTQLSIQTKIDEIPTNAIVLIDGKESQLTKFEIEQTAKHLTIKSGAFQNLNNLQEISLRVSNLSKIESGAFNFNKTSDKELTIIFHSSNYKNKNIVHFSGDLFQNGTFHGIKRQTVHVQFEMPKLDYIPESSFKTILDQNKNNTIKIFDVVYKTLIDCEDCRNYWLIKDNRKTQIKHAICLNSNRNFTKTLFDDDVVSKLKTKC